MKSTAEQPRINRPLPERASTGKRIERWLGIPFNFIEKLGFLLATQPMQRALSTLDALSYKIEGTLFRKILTHAIFPVVIVLDFVHTTAVQYVAQRVIVTRIGIARANEKIDFYHDLGTRGDLVRSGRAKRVVQIFTPHLRQDRVGPI